MNRSNTWRAWFLLALGGPLLCLAGESEAAGPLWIKEFVEQKQEWAEWAESRRSLRVEGRLSLVAANTLKFHNCPLEFVAGRGVQFRKPAGDAPNFEVSGRLAADSGKLVFVVERFLQRPSDRESIAQRERAIDANDARAWYDLAGWIDDRSGFYNDKELAPRAASARLKGLETERRQLKDKDTAGRLQLAAKVEQLKLPEALRFELLHEGYSLRWQLASRDDKPLLLSLAAEMDRDLPGCTTSSELPAAEWTKLNETYFKQPLAVYRTADAETRGRLHRVLYARIVQTAILLDADAEGRNGIEIAERLDRQLPELAALADSYRDRELRFRMGNVAALTEQEMLDLAGTFEAKQQPATARRVKQQWLELRRTQLSKEGTAGLIRAAEDYQRLLDDDKTAAELLIEAYRQNPASDQVQKRLQELGFTLREGEWLTAEQLAALPKDDVSRAIREGQVLEGMTRRQVLASRGAPTHTSRIASARHIIEVWVYRDAADSIKFVRRRSKSDDEPVVVK